MDLSLLNLMCGHLGFSCMKSLHMERFLIQVWACVYTITLVSVLKSKENTQGKSWHLTVVTAVIWKMSCR